MRHSAAHPVFLVLGLLVTGCAAPPLRNVPQSGDLVRIEQIPIRVQPDQTESIAFGKIIIELPVGATVGRIMVDDQIIRSVPNSDARLLPGLADWALACTQELRDAGYPTTRDDNILFNQADTAKSRYIISGMLRDITWVVHRSRNAQADSQTPLECGVGINWELFDTNSRKVVYSNLVYGYAIVPGFWPVVHDGIRCSFRNLLADRAFLNAMTSGGAAAAKTPLTPAYPTKMSIISPKTSELELPRDMQRVNDSVVTVRVGSVHGSGFFISNGGCILTAAHVVSGRDTCLVTLNNGKEVEARVRRIDVETDVALLRVTDGDYPALQLATGDPPAAGSEVYAIGTPLTADLAHTVSKGIVSAYRKLPPCPTIQTDAAVNPGNSGGPLVDHAGHVLGIVSQKVVAPEFSGIAFAVPTQVAMKRLGIEFVASGTAPVAQAKP